jgi:hypothetical protein
LANGCSCDGSGIRKEDTSWADVGSKGVGVKDECGSGDGEGAVGEELDLRPVRVSHLLIVSIETYVMEQVRTNIVMIADVWVTLKLVMRHEKKLTAR